MSAQPVDLEQIDVDLAGAMKVAVANPDLGVMIALQSLQLQLAIAQDTRRQAAATEALVKELHALRRKAS